MASANTEHHLPNRTLRKPPQDKQEAPKQPQSKQRPGVGRGKEGKQETWPKSQICNEIERFQNSKVSFWLQIGNNSKWHADHEAWKGGQVAREGHQAQGNQGRPPTGG